MAGHNNYLPKNINGLGNEAFANTLFIDKAIFKTQPWVDPTHPFFGADPTGIVDATSAINTAMNYAVDNDIAEVRIPEGIYKLVPDATGYMLIIPPGLKLLSGTKNSILRVADNVGEYVAIISNRTNVIVNNIPNFNLENLVINQNTTNNQIANIVPLFAGFPRYCVYITLSDTENSVKFCEFQDLDCVNAISITASSKDCYIEENAFILGSCLVNHDFSCIYSNNTDYPNAGVWILKNTFDTLLPLGGANAARTAIETHGGSQNIHGNIIRGYQKGFNITGISVYTGAGIVCSGNMVSGAKFGAQLWSRTYHTNLGPIGLKGLVLRDNTFNLNGPIWAPLFGGNGYSTGIFLDTSADLPFEDVIINSNRINFATGTGYVGQAGDSVGNGIDWRRNPQGSIIDLRIMICDNIIDHPLASGIRLATNGAGFKVNGNIIHDVGQGSIAAGGLLSNSFACGVIVTGSYNNSEINNNLIIDDQLIPTTQYGFYLLLSEAGINLDIKDNKVPVSNNRPIETSPTFGTWFISMIQNPVVLPTGLIAAGSEIINGATGEVYRQTTIPEGISWKLFTPGNVTPTDLSFPIPGTLYLPGIIGNYITTPATLAMDPTNAFRLRIDCALDDWTATNYLLARWTSPTTTLLWIAYVSGGRLQFAAITGGQVATSGLLNTAAGVRIIVEFNITQTTGVVSFRKSLDNGTSWIDLGVFSNTIGGAFALPTASGIPLSIGGFATVASNYMKGIIYSSDFYNVTAATTISFLDLTEPSSLPIDDQGNQWTVLGDDWTITPMFVGSINGESGVVTIPEDGAAITPSLRTLGEGALQAAAGNDPRFLTTSPLPSRANVVGSWAVLSCRPCTLPIGTSTYAKDIWRYIPFKLDSAWSIDAFAINTTTPASGGTAAMIFGLFNLNSSNQPNSRIADYSSYGSIDLTPAAGIQQLTTAGLILPAGENYIGCAWSGTAGVSPVLSTFSGIHPTIATGTAAIIATAFQQGISGASVPPNATVNTSSTPGAVIWVKIH